MQSKGSLYSDIPEQLKDELFTTLMEKKGVKIERIVSDGHSSPTDFWYDQDQDEFVLLIKGCATLEFDGKYPCETLAEGEYFFIPAHRKHRVKSTAGNMKTVWLAIFV